jgi:glycosyltransferase involved in cell wall biosynthesis
MMVTVAICTWNRAALLERTLAAMCSIRIPDGVSWELLVVNNNSTDNTDDVLSRYCARLPLRRLYEPKQGLSHARNCAVSAANGDLLIWTDDDVLVDPDWLGEYAEAAQAHPDFSFFGGTVNPWFEVEPPAWITQHLTCFQGPYAIRQLGGEVRPLTEDEEPFGANMAIRMNVAAAFSFDTELGRKGNGMLSGDESELTKRIKTRGHRGLWVGPARVRHFITAGRLNARYLRKWFYEGGRSNIRMDGIGQDWRWFADMPLFALKALWQARLKRAVFWYGKDRGWAKAFGDVPYYKGLIAEARVVRRTMRQVSGEGVDNAKRLCGVVRIGANLIKD